MLVANRMKAVNILPKGIDDGRNPRLRQRDLLG